MGLSVRGDSVILGVILLVVLGVVLLGGGILWQKRVVDTGWMPAVEHQRFVDERGAAEKEKEVAAAAVRKEERAARKRAAAEDNTNA